MKYTEHGDTITLEMSRDDYEGLLLMLGFAAGAASRKGELHTYWRWIDFVNRLNDGNPRFTPYEIPEEFKGARP